MNQWWTVNHTVLEFRTPMNVFILFTHLSKRVAEIMCLTKHGCTSCIAYRKESVFIREITARTLMVVLAAYADSTAFTVVSKFSQFVTFDASPSGRLSAHTHRHAHTHARARRIRTQYKHKLAHALLLIKAVSYTHLLYTLC